MQLNGLNEMKEAVMTAKNETEERQALAACLDKNKQKYEWMVDGRIKVITKRNDSNNGIFTAYEAAKKEKTAKAKEQAKEARRAALTDAERKAEDDAKAILHLGKARNGAPYIKVRSYYKVEETILFNGVIFKTAGAGKTYDSYGKEVKNVYIEKTGWVLTDKAEYKTWKAHAMAEFENSRESFNRMMENEDQVCCTQECKLWGEIAKALQSRFEASDRKIKVYLSSCGWGDFEAVYWQGSNKVAKEQYLKEAHEILKNGGDVDHRNQTDEELMTAFEKANKEQGR